MLRSIGGLGAVGLATAEIADVNATPSGVRRKRITGHIEPDAPNWLYVPVDVDEGVTELHVSYDYDKSAENLLDIGMADPDGHELGNGDGFRGWSGGARSEFTISRSEATPGYYPGEIEPGTWNVILGPYRVGAEGIDYTIEVTMRSGEPEPAFEPRPVSDEPINDEPGWYRGDLHLHTVHSDGEYTPGDLVDGAVDAGLDFLVSTDHNTTTANLVWGRHARSDFLILNGEEITTRAGHFGALGLEPEQWIDWRYAPDDDALSRFVEEVHDVGGIAVANHPFCPYKGCDWRFDYERMDAVEVWNGPWTWEDEAAVQTWDRMLREGRYLPAVGASDAHDYEDDIGVPHTVVHAPRLGRDAVLAGLAAGRSYVVESDAITLDVRAVSGSHEAIPGERLERPPKAPITVELAVRGAPGSEVTFHTQDSIVKTVSVTEDRQRIAYETTAEASAFVRIELRTADGDMLALTNPVFLGRA
ncbi:CehA/McbA family metallohydrolase [Halomarina halobia]|uniref:CehA/McbA family metallohydrolase n=1 Tax=Halomarina halobia TaxID=3033386 RepID=UPI0023E7C0D4|nr:CehA/McbA family metallohydrolase [Halomarina sp. PSR21]